MKKLLTGRILIILSAIFMFPSLSYAQDRTITGLVSDESTGDPVVGATVRIEGTTIGTITDINGNFSIRITSEEDVLSFSFIGYKSQSETVGDRTEINIALSLDLTQIDEVVVVGYGVQKRDDLTGSISVVDVDEMTSANFNSFDKALQGRAAGVHITSVSGRPGERAAVKIRGIGSISMGTEPLYVIDGVPSDGDAMITLNPSDVESLQVLKDASATAIYGARGANGVILITTKKGSSDKINVSFSANTGTSVLSKKFDVMNAAEYTNFMENAYTAYLQKYPDETNTFRNIYSDSARQANDNYDTDTDWQDLITRVGKTNNYNLSISGGSENSSYYVSGNYTKEEGILVGTEMERFSLRANSEFQIMKNIKVGESVAVSRVNADDISHNTQGNPWLISTTTSPYMPVYDENALGGFGGPTDSLTGNNERTNPLAEQVLNENYYNEDRIMTSVFAEIQILEGLNYTARFGYNIYNTYRMMFSPEYSLGNLRLRDNDVSKLENQNEYNNSFLMSHILNYSKSFKNHNLNLMAAFERSSDKQHYNNAIGREISNSSLLVLDQVEEVFDVNGQESEHKLESYLARLNYDFKGKYLVTASIRVDGSTRFGPLGGRYGTFPSFSAGWKINEDFLTNVSDINMLKLRVGWGQTGNENINDYQYFAVIDAKRNSRYNFGDDQSLYLAGAPTSYQANPYVKWEAAEMTNIAIDLNAFGNRLIFNAEYYIKNQNDMLVNKSISTTFGKYVDYGAGGTVGAWVNIGKVRNTGFEFNASWRKLEGDFRYSISGNLSTLKNEVLDLGDNNDIITDYTITRKGNTIGSFYGHIAERILQPDDFEQDSEGNLIADASGNYTLLHATQELGTSPGDLKFKDVNQDGVINNLDKVVIGKSLPDFIYGLNFDASYKGFDFTIFLQGMQNMDVYSDHLSSISLATDRYGKDENKLNEVNDFWTYENLSTTQTRVSVVDENLNARVSSWFVKEASFLRIKSIQLGYTIPSNISQRINISNIRVFASVNNLYTFTKYEGYDPEVGDYDPSTRTRDILNNGVDKGNYPVPRTNLIGLQFNF